MKLSRIAEDICRPLEAATGKPVIIAGGAVRDRFFGRKPRDYDVFILEGKLGPPMHNKTVKDARLWVKSMLTDARFTEMITAAGDYVGPENHGPVVSFKFCGLPVQVMVAPFKEVPALLDTFDYNICQFAYRYGEVTKPAAKWKTIKLNRDAVKFPLLAFKRGMEFSRRYNVKFKDDDIGWLLAEQANAPKIDSGVSFTEKYFSALYGGTTHKSEKYEVSGMPVELTPAIPAMPKLNGALTYPHYYEMWLDEPAMWAKKASKAQSVVESFAEMPL